MYLGPSNPPSSPVLALMFSNPLLVDDLLLDNRPLPQVLTATRLKQSPAAVPGSMTIIDSELIKTSGARVISELLRLVPGMMVGSISGNQATVNYHGTNASAARRMENYTATQAPRGMPTERALANQVLEQWKGGARQTLCGDIDQSTRESRYDLELQDTLSLSDSLRLVSGMNYRYDKADSETYFNGTLDDTIWRLFDQLEWRASEHWLLQGGAMFEDTRLTGSSLTPRVAVNYLINPRHGLRAVYSEAIRSPDMFENNINWSYQVTNLNPKAYGQSSAQYFVKTRGPGDPEKERMRSRELGYNGFFADIGLTVDMKLFYDEITGMISEPLRNNQYIASNSNASRFSGTETQLDWRMSATFSTSARS